MNKYYGTIGYAETIEEDPINEPGIYIERYTERQYYGDILGISLLNQKSEGVNDDVVLSNRVSIISDDYAIKHVACMRYIVINGVKWKISSVEEKYPRLNISTGGLYNAHP